MSNVKGKCMHTPLKKEENLFSGRDLLFLSVPDIFRRHHKYEVVLKSCFGVTSEPPKDFFRTSVSSRKHIKGIFLSAFFQSSFRFLSEFRINTKRNLKETRQNTVLNAFHKRLPDNLIP
jgi:hypothetical protein